MALEVFVVIRCWVESPINPKKRVSVQISKVLEQGHALGSRELFAFCKVAVAVGHQGSMKLEISNMSWVLSDSMKA